MLSWWAGAPRRMFDSRQRQARCAEAGAASGTTAPTPGGPYRAYHSYFVGICSSYEILREPGGPLSSSGRLVKLGRINRFRFSSGKDLKIVARNEMGVSLNHNRDSFSGVFTYRERCRLTCRASVNVHGDVRGMGRSWMFRLW